MMKKHAEAQPFAGGHTLVSGHLGLEQGLWESNRRLLSRLALSDLGVLPLRT